LGKASLYHHFPGGKAEMAEAALTQMNQWLEKSILPILVGAASMEENREAMPIDTFQSMCEEVNHFFNEGQNSCLWAVLELEQSSDDLFHSQISWAFSQWIEAIANVLITAGLDETLAKQPGEDAMISIQGALILSHGLKDFGPFQRTLQQLPQQLCRSI
jgi:TetR/AcrR family transcriptional regulator, lmrAB and yxaGH operons repressor